MLQMRSIQHLPVKRHCSTTGIRIESGDDALRVCEFSGGWCEGLVDDRDLGGMDGQHSLESVTARGLCIGAQALDIPISGVDGFDCRDADSRGSGNT